MNTPIRDFVRRYAAEDTLRLHMPGHKGYPMLGLEPLDITEIPGADSLYEASGIIAESERNASTLFGCPTFYSTEGSSHGIRAMLHLACLWAREQGRRPVIAAGRNAHKVFLSAAALLDFEVQWLYGHEQSYLSCHITPEDLEKELENRAVTAVYVTSPDYFGNTLDVAALAKVCRRHHALLLVDNAHGAYLKFCSPSRHPMDLGADLCCDSAHKTLPVLTGGAYLHIAEEHKTLINQAKSALALFGSTSPSYLILQSLDEANALCAVDFPLDLAEAVKHVGWLKSHLKARGFLLIGNEPLKLTLAPKGFGYLGTQVAEFLERQGIVCEFADPDFVVMMFSPFEPADVCDSIQRVLAGLPKAPEIPTAPPVPGPHEAVKTFRDAALSPAEDLPADQCAGRILATPTVGCPPAVPIVACGERITKADLSAFAYYGIHTLSVVKNEKEQGNTNER